MKYLFAENSDNNIIILTILRSISKFERLTLLCTCTGWRIIFLASGLLTSTLTPIFSSRRLFVSAIFSAAPYIGFSLPLKSLC